MNSKNNLWIKFGRSEFQEADQAIIPLSIIRHSAGPTDRVHLTVAVTIRDGINVSLPVGSYSVQAYLPSGEVIVSPEVNMTEEGEHQVTLHPQRRAPCNELAWAYYCKPGSRRIRALSHDDVGPDHYREKRVSSEKVKARLWECSNSHWEQRGQPTTNIRHDHGCDADAGFVALFDVGHASRMEWLQISTPQTRARCIALPPANNNTVFIYNDYVTDDAEDPLSVAVSCGDLRAESLLSFLAMGDWPSACIVGQKIAKLVEKDTFDAGDNLAATIIFAYYLLAAREYDSLTNVLGRLESQADWISDTKIIKAWLLLRQREPDLESACVELIDATDDGLPFYTQGLRLLIDGLQMFEAKDSGQSGRIKEVLDRITPYVAVTDWKALTTSFFADDPGHPLSRPRIKTVASGKPVRLEYVAYDDEPAHPVYTGSHGLDGGTISVAIATTTKRGLRKTRVGTVVSTKMQKTAVVETVTRVPHPKFRKIIKQSKKFYVHDEEGEAQEGDLVRIMETRPLSKLKRWRLVEVLKH